MAKYLFLIRALEPLHAGGGDSNYGAVDKLVQMNQTTMLPTIHGHSLKGAIRAFFETKLKYTEDSPFIKTVFGSPVKRAVGTDPEQGNAIFMAADLVSIPIPEENHKETVLFHRCISESQWNTSMQKAKLLGLNVNFTTEQIKKMIGDNCLNNEATFKIAAKRLPIIARNYLENGHSENLWYEQFVPSESYFLTLIITDGMEKAHETTFIQGIDGKVIQVGANATVGYGYTLFTKIA
jgi:CRISPR-associated protein Cmr4